MVNADREFRPKKGELIQIHLRMKNSRFLFETILVPCFVIGPLRSHRIEAMNPQKRPC